jgi:hypothetical protein
VPEAARKGETNGSERVNINRTDQPHSKRAGSRPGLCAAAAGAFGITCFRRFGLRPAPQPVSLAARRFGSNAWRSFEIVPTWRISPLRPSSATAAVIIEVSAQENACAFQ